MCVGAPFSAGAWKLFAPLTPRSLRSRRPSPPRGEGTRAANGFALAAYCRSQWHHVSIRKGAASSALPYPLFSILYPLISDLCP